MAVDKFIPEIWSALLLEHLDNVHVYASLVNRNYEGDIKAYGDTVHINQIGDITIGDYTGSLGEPEDLDQDQKDLKIDKAKYFNFKVDDVNNAQTNPKLMGAAMQRASYGMNDTVDTYLAGLLKTNATAVNPDASPIVPTKDTAYDLLVDMGTMLSENNVPKVGRWVVVPHWYHGLLLKDPRFVGNGTEYNKAILEGGLVGAAAGFEIYVSNNVPHTNKTKYKLLAGTDAAATYAEQLVKMEALRAQNAFADIIRGLHVFGAKVTQPKGIVCMTCNKS